MSNETSSNTRQYTQEHSTNFSWVREIVLGLILSDRSRSPFEVMTAELESISPLERTPQTSNNRSTPPDERGRDTSANSSVALRRIRFQNSVATVPEEQPEDELGDDEMEDVPMSSFLTDSELEKLYELGYDSNGELAPYANQSVDYNELEKPVMYQLAPRLVRNHHSHQNHHPHQQHQLMILS